jgi:alkaline phosphatase D
LSEPLNRRSFVKGAGGAALSTSAWRASGPAPVSEQEPQTAFHSTWPSALERPWPGPDYWPNPLQDWRVRAGRLECFSAGGDRNVGLLTRTAADRPGELHLSVRCGPIDGTALEQGFVGFRVGIKHQIEDYRAAAVYGRGMNAGIAADGRLFIGSVKDSAPRVSLSGELHLELQARPSPTGYAVKLTATLSGKSQQIAREVPAPWLTGALALVCSSGPVDPTPAELSPIKDFSFYPPNQQRGGDMRFWFADWMVAGSKVDRHADRAYGPILFTLHTVSRAAESTCRSPTITRRGKPSRPQNSTGMHGTRPFV